MPEKALPPGHAFEALLSQLGMRGNAFPYICFMASICFRDFQGLFGLYAPTVRSEL